MSFNINNISLLQSKQFSKLMLDYCDNCEELRPLFNQHFSKLDIHQLVSNFNFDKQQRELLAAELINQTAGLNLSDATTKNINSLKNDNTYTITTGHQLCLFSGPLYFIYKILSVIVQCEEYNKLYPEFHFVPVFWMAGEDHDKEEINHAHVFGKKISWQTEQTGKVGTYSLENISTAINQLKEILGHSENADSIMKLVEKAYSASTLNEATKCLVNELFGEFGLVIIDPDHAPFKQVIAHEIKKEIKEPFIKKNVDAAITYLANHGYKAQVNPRAINLFYAKDNIRERIIFSDNQYQVLNTALTFSIDEMEVLLEEQIEVFSPNVLMRPLYQQKLLPNLVYVGGPGEIAYWLQLKLMFDDANVFFPVLQPRKFALLLNEKHLLKWQNLGLSTEDIFLSLEEVEKKIVATDFKGFEEEKTNSIEFFEALNSKVKAIDFSLSGTVESEKQKLLKGLEHLEQKVSRSIKQKNETSIQQLKKIKNTYFPAHSIQERYDNFINYYSANLNLIQDLKTTFEKCPCAESSYLILINK